MLFRIILCFILFLNNTSNRAKNVISSVCFIRNAGAVINSANSEHTVVIAADGKTMYISSIRPEKLGFSIDKSDEFSIDNSEDIFFSEISSSEIWTTPKNINPPINTKENEAILDISKDGKKMLLYSSAKNLGDIYISEKKDYGWSKPVSLGKNINTEFSEISASFGKDEKEIYFVSNRTGSLGGYDIYLSTMDKSGIWGPAKNLGNEINSSEDETDPFFFNETQTLFFSSKGHNSIGGFDIFKSNFSSNNWSIPANLGNTINTSDNEISYKITVLSERGYFCSNRKGGFGSYDIYFVECNSGHINNKDSIPPVIELNFPKVSNNATFYGNDNNIVVDGVVSDLSGVSFITVNGLSVVVSENGNFKHPLKMNEGNNIIQIISGDKLGNKNSFIFIYNLKQDLRNEVENITKINSVKEKDLISNSGKYYALIIGIQDYLDDEFQDLEQPVKDAKKLVELLTQKYTFEEENTLLLLNATYDDLIIALDNLSNKINEKDNLLIFYAGHGYWDSEKKIGFWLPTDARISNTSKWFRNSTLKDYIGSIKSKHTLLIADACFSGGIFKTRSAFTDATDDINKLYELPSRKAITSGTLTEVPDQSIFIEYLLKRLNQNDKKYLSSEELFSSMRKAVLLNSPTVPQFGEIKDVGDEGGDFIFIKKE